MSTTLKKFDAARKALAVATTVDEVKEIRDKAEAMRAYARQAGESLEMQNQCAVIKLRSERRAGEMLIEMKSTGQITEHRPSKEVSHDVTLLRDLDISRNESSRWQKLASIDEDVFENEIKSTVDAGKELTTSAMLKVARRQKHDDEPLPPPSSEWTVTDEQDVRECSAVITDPPYGILDESWEPEELEDFTREWADRWNGCGADSFLIFWSQRHLWDGRKWFDEELENYTFQQLLVWHYPNNKSPQNRDGFKQTWEPCFFYRRKESTRQIKLGQGQWGEGLNDFDCHVAAVPQSNFNDDNEKVHPAQKPVSVFRWLVNATTAPGECVCDPFCGSGASGIAARQLGRTYYGIEISKEYREVASKRIAKYGIVR